MHFIISFSPIKIQNISIILESSLRPTPDQLLPYLPEATIVFIYFPIGSFGLSQNFLVNGTIECVFFCVQCQVHKVFLVFIHVVPYISDLFSFISCLVK